MHAHVQAIPFDAECPAEEEEQIQQQAKQAHIRRRLERRWSSGPPSCCLEGPAGVKASSCFLLNMLVMLYPVSLPYPGCMYTTLLDVSGEAVDVGCSAFNCPQLLYQDLH